MAPQSLAYATQRASSSRLADRARRVVREAEVHEVHRLAGKLRKKATLLAARQIEQALVCALCIGVPGPPRHHIRVDVDRVDGIRDRHAGARREDLLDVSTVALRAVGDEDLIRGRSRRPRAA